MSIKILLADDSITIQKVIGIIFGSDEYALTVVDNGKDALDKAREIVPDVLLIDALMPGMTGYEVCEAVRATPTLAAQPILLLTGSFEPFDETKAKSCGADDFLAKPFESQQIVSKVKALFELGMSRISSAALTQPLQETPEFQTPATLAPAAPAAIDSAKPDDIWGAFTFAEAPAESVAAPATPSEPAPVTEQSDVFTMVNEEPDFEAIQSPIPQTIQETSGSQWIPVQEQTFEFAPEPVTETPAATFSEPLASTQPMTFGDISFKEIAQETAPAEALPSIEEPLTPPPAPVEKASAPVISPLPAVSEEQLRAAVAGASKEVIERIVWEIVPDLAEAMIRDAILKIQEGR